MRVHSLVELEGLIIIGTYGADRGNKRRAIVRRVRVLLTLALLAFVALLIQAISGFVLWFVLPLGVGGRGGGTG